MEKFIIFKKGKYFFAIPLMNIERVGERREEGISEEFISDALGSKEGEFLAYCFSEKRTIVLPVDSVVGIVEGMKGYHELPERVKCERNRFIKGILITSSGACFILDIDEFFM